jgi:hypothetical protein
MGPDELAEGAVESQASAVEGVENARWQRPGVRKMVGVGRSTDESYSVLWCRFPRANAGRSLVPPQLSRHDRSIFRVDFALTVQKI